MYLCGLDFEEDVDVVCDVIFCVILGFIGVEFVNVVNEVVLLSVRDGR